MSILHHVTDEHLYLYASGELGTGWSLAVATHLSFCARCRMQVADYEAALAWELDEMSPAPMETCSPEAIMRSVDSTPVARQGEAPQSLMPTRVSERKSILPRPLRDLTGDLEDIRWTSVGGGVRQKIVLEEGNVIARLLHISPGVAVPAHGHGGLEMTQVVQGGFYDGEKGFSRGDIQIVAHESPHQPLAFHDEGCMTLAVTDAPLKFSNFLPRLFQPLLRI